MRVLCKYLYYFGIGSLNRLLLINYVGELLFRSPKNRSSSSNIPSVLKFIDCLAKTFSESSGTIREGRNVFNHCQIVGEVAKSLLNRMPIGLREKIFPEGAELVAAAHDIGKVSPCFQEKIRRFTKGYRYNSLPALSQIKHPEIERNWGGHAGVSQATLRFLNIGEGVPEIVGSHHGFTPSLGGAIASDELFGGKLWQIQRENLVVELKHYFNCDWPNIRTPEQALALAGLTTVADWIGSGSYFEDPASAWAPNVERALDNAGFVRPKLRGNLSFKDIFEEPPYSLQQAFIESVERPGVYILEAPMGAGKTEAALYAGYLAMLKLDATGLYFALPTQLTSDKIFDRVNKFLDVILEKGSPHREALLLHANAWLRETEMGVEGQPGEAWFDGTKRGILAPFAVGTIDQALMAVMNVKHGFVRTFGLAGKVVILDEVHSYNAYTGTLLEELVKGLRKLHCTVIILSATLNTERRTQLLGAVPCKNNYPLVSALPNNCDLKEVAVEAMPDATVQLFYTEQANALSEALIRAEQGQYILWIENTVNQAQEIYKMLSARGHEMGIPCGLLHSRFSKIDRSINEQKWVQLYSKAGAKERGKIGHVLVGTQVLEQSLDIDADFLVVRFCPTDFLLQRLGRLWRHAKTPRQTGARREAWVIAPELQTAIDNPEQAFGNTAYVYNPYVLCRSLEVWHDKLAIKIPGDIRGLIEATYHQREEQNPMSIWKHELIKGNRKKHRVGLDAMKRFAQIGLAKAGTTLPEESAKTRYSEQDSVQVLLLRRIQHEKGEPVQLTLLNGETLTLPVHVKVKNKRQWRKLAAKVLQQVVNVAVHLAPATVSQKNIAWLSDYLYLGNRDKDESQVRVILLDTCGEMTLPGGEPVSNKYDLYYDKSLGYQANKKIKDSE